MSVGIGLSSTTRGYLWKILYFPKINYSFTFYVGQSTYYDYVHSGLFYDFFQSFVIVLGYLFSFFLRFSTKILRALTSNESVKMMNPPKQFNLMKIQENVIAGDNILYLLLVFYKINPYPILYRAKSYCVACTK